MERGDFQTYKDIGISSLSSELTFWSGKVGKKKKRNKKIKAKKKKFESIFFF